MSESEQKTEKKYRFSPDVQAAAAIYNLQERMDHDEELVAVVVDAFLEHIPKLEEDLDAAYAEGNRELIQYNVDRISSALRLFAVNDLIDSFESFDEKRKGAFAEPLAEIKGVLAAMAKKLGGWKKKREE